MRWTSGMFSGLRFQARKVGPSLVHTDTRAPFKLFMEPSHMTAYLSAGNVQRNT